VNMRVTIPWDRDELRKLVTKSVLVVSVTVVFFAFDSYVSAKQNYAVESAVQASREYTDERSSNIQEDLSTIILGIQEIRETQEQYLADFIEFRIQVAEGTATKEEVSALRRELDSIRSRQMSVPVSSQGSHSLP